MKHNKLFRTELEKISEKEKNRYNLMYRVSENIDMIIRHRGMSQRDFAKQMGRTEQEIGRWLGGFHNFTLATIADISFVLGEDILNTHIQYKQTSDVLFAAETMSKYTKK